MSYGRGIFHYKMIFRLQKICFDYVIFLLIKNEKMKVVYPKFRTHFHDFFRPKTHPEGPLIPVLLFREVTHPHRESPLPPSPTNYIGRSNSSTFVCLFVLNDFRWVVFWILTLVFYILLFHALVYIYE